MNLYLGVLVPKRRVDRLKAGAFRFWHDFARRQEERFAVKLVFLSPRQVELGAGVAHGLVPGRTGWQEQVIEPGPQFYYNQLVIPAPAESRALRDLNGDLNVVLFNETNRWNRGMVYSMLESVPALKEYLPETLSFHPDDAAALKEKGLFLLAPARRAVREAGLLIRCDGTNRVEYQMVSGRTNGQLCLTDRDALRRSLPGNLRWASRLGDWPSGPGGPVEWRIYLHRTSRSSWTVAGAVAKRDVLRGRQRECCWRLHEALTLSFGAGASTLADRLYAAALAIVESLALFIPGIAHCALDFWMDRAGHPVLLDLSGHYRTDWLRRVGDLKAVEQVLSHPARFARHMASTGGERLHVGFPCARYPSGTGGLPSVHDYELDL